ncbi:olfactory receptor 8D1-like [Ambystoma mexicanum]|uniref:olfactory receptor 8D1-like n=1 Tax=Ambystoma mexicanum TaxID=8296 RepID=UPI0037E8C826
MPWGNCTKITEFILLGLTDLPELQLTLFILFLAMYFMTVAGNIGMILLILVNPRLQIPMYFFLGNLSLVDLCYSSVITPKMLVNFLAERNSIMFHSCAVQLFAFALFGTTECFLLTVMAYDRFLAICHPLIYSAVMTQRLCHLLVLGSFFCGLLNSALNLAGTFRLSYCGSNEIQHFYCDFLPILDLASSDTYASKVVLFICADFLTMSAISVIVFSYVSILRRILAIRSSEGRRKAFSTCSSHFTCVILFYGTILFMYLRPTSSSSRDADRVASVLYTVVIPMINPLIYSLRNTEVKKAIGRTLHRIQCLQSV